MSQQQKTEAAKPQEDDEEEFQTLLGTFTSRLTARVDSAVSAKELAEQHKSNPLLAVVKACIADRQAGRVDPKASPLWGTRELN